MRTPLLLLAALAPALALSGCVFGGAGEAEVTDPLREGPHFVLVVQNGLDTDVHVQWRLIGPDGSEDGTGALDVEAHGAAEGAGAIAGHGSHRLQVSYSWTDQGRAASGSAEATFDTRACDGAPRVDVSIGTNADGRTYAGASATC